MPGFVSQESEGKVVADPSNGFVRRDPLSLPRASNARSLHAPVNALLTSDRADYDEFAAPTAISRHKNRLKSHLSERGREPPEVEQCISNQATQNGVCLPAAQPAQEPLPISVNS